jgi:nitrogen fixation NifU-like protein
MSDNAMRELYQEVILDHNKNPRNYRVMGDANRHAQGNNPLCGDQIEIFLRVSDAGIIEDASFQGSGCAISKSSASLMTILVKGKSIDDAEELFNKFHAVVMSGPAAELSEESLEELGKLSVFAGVRDYPARVKCASLAWHTVHAAIENAPEPISTE